MNAEVLLPGSFTSRLPLLGLKNPASNINNSPERVRKNILEKLAYSTIKVGQNADPVIWQDPAICRDAVRALSRYYSDLSVLPAVLGLDIGHGNPDIFSRFLVNIVLNGRVFNSAVEDGVIGAGRQLLDSFSSIIPTEFHELHLKNPYEYANALGEWKKRFDGEIQLYSHISLPSGDMVVGR